MSIKKLLLISTAMFATGLSSVAVSAQEQAADATETVEDETQAITVLGSRGQPRSSTDSPVPVDVLRAEDIQAQGNTDIIDALTSVVPSLSASREPISDAATLVRPVNLRALPSDSTLVLVNGKRRHRGAVVGEFVTGVNRGAQGVDINPLFGAGLKQVEVLRDGAAAQYGSDAIAGVINYQLLTDPEIRKIDLQYTQSYEGDGKTFEGSAAFGVKVGDGGFVTIALQARKQGATSRGVQDGQTLTGPLEGAAALGAAGFPVANPVVVWGQPKVKDDYKALINAAVPIGGAEGYFFGSFATRDVDGSFFYRNPARRQGVFANGANVLFGNTTGVGACPAGPLPTASFAAAQAFINTAPANCFSFFRQFPGGFTPRFGGKVKDTSGTFGIRGEFGNGLKYDLSAGAGKNDVAYRISNTVNASLGAASPTEFDLGSQIQQEIVANADFSFPVVIGSDAGLNIAFGGQYLDEKFTITQGEPDSYRAGPLASQGFSVGSNGFQGFSDRVAGKFSRNSIGFYVDAEANVTDKFVFSTAARYEKYSDFGSTLVGKASLLYHLTDGLAVRGSASTGFRAPTLGQSNLQRASTSFAGGQLIESLVIASTSPIAQFFGGGQLDAENARNFSAGVTAKLGRLTLTVDYFNIKVTDRVSLIQRAISPAQRTQLLNLGISEAATVSEVQFFVNDFDTLTQGIDFVANLPINSSLGKTQLTLAYNLNDTKVTNAGATISAGRQREIEDALPRDRFTFTASHEAGIFNGLIRVNYYGKAYESLFNDDTLPVVTPSLFSVDAEVGLKFADMFRVSAGAKNLFDKYPQQWQIGNDTGRNGGYLGAIYPLNHPGGFNGGSYYIRLSADF
jgi:iron complex outermembrane recepter protein